MNLVGPEDQAVLLDLEDLGDLVGQEEQVAQEDQEDQLHLGGLETQGVRKVLEDRTVQAVQGGLVALGGRKDLLCLEVQVDQKDLGDLAVLAAHRDPKHLLFQEVLVIQVVLEVQEALVDLGDQEDLGDLMDQHHPGDLGSLEVR